MKVILWILKSLIALVVLQTVAWVVFWMWAARRDTGWSGEHQEAGPLPLSSPDTPIVRLVDKRSTFENDFKRLLWDEGNGPIEAEDRIKALLDSVPKEFMDRMRTTAKVPAKFFPALHDDTGTTDEAIYDARGIVVSLNPDVLLVSVFGTRWGSAEPLSRNWDGLSIDAARRAYIDARIEHISYRYSSPRIYAGTLVPWSKEMHVFSTDPKIKNWRLQFGNDRAEVPLPVGKLVLVHHEDDVDVTRQ